MCPELYTEVWKSLVPRQAVPTSSVGRHNRSPPMALGPLARLAPHLERTDTPERLEVSIAGHQNLVIEDILASLREPELSRGHRNRNFRKVWRASQELSHRDHQGEPERL